MADQIENKQPARIYPLFKGDTSTIPAPLSIPDRPKTITFAQNITVGANATSNFSLSTLPIPSPIDLGKICTRNTPFIFRPYRFGIVLDATAVTLGLLKFQTASWWLFDSHNATAILGDTPYQQTSLNFYRFPLNFPNIPAILYNLFSDFDPMSMFLNGILLDANFIIQNTDAAPHNVGVTANLLYDVEDVPDNYQA